MLHGNKTTITETMWRQLVIAPKSPINFGRKSISCVNSLGHLNFLCSSASSKLRLHLEKASNCLLDDGQMNKTTKEVILH